MFGQDKTEATPPQPSQREGAKVYLWEGTKVHARSVTLEAFLPSEPYSAPVTNSPSLWEGRGGVDLGGVAVIVCPGGSYSWHDRETEGYDVARWLQHNGIAAFVLNYRVQGIFQFVTHSRLVVPGRQHPKMLQDIQMALLHVRQHADEYGIDKNKVGAMGFSAGGHLVMSAAEFFHTDFISAKGISVTESLRPDFVAPIYPVVTLREDVTHKRSRRALLGEYGKYKKCMRDSLSLELHVPDDCPPVFLVNCKDDPVVKYQNSMLLDSALTQKHISHRYIQYATGGHGFGASDTKGSPECRQWREEFLRWLKTLFDVNVNVNVNEANHQFSRFNLQ